MAQAEAATNESHGHHADHEKHYWKIYFILLVLLAVSVAGPMLEIQVVTLVTAFGIAVVKAYLVVKHFMHLTIEPKYVGYLCATSLVFMGLLFFFVAPDVMRHDGTNWENAAAKAVTGELTEAAGGPEDFVAAAEFKSVCASCHGEGGLGDGPAAAALNPKPANFATAEFWQTRDREQVINVIANGGPAVGKSPVMAAFGATYTDEQIEQLADIVIGFGPEEAGDQPVAEEKAEGEEGQLVAQEGTDDKETGEEETGEEETGASEEAVAEAPTEESPEPGVTPGEIRARAAFIEDRIGAQMAGGG